MQWEHGGVHVAFAEREYACGLARTRRQASLPRACNSLREERRRTTTAGHHQWVDTALQMGAMTRDDRWSKSVAVGSEQFVEQVKAELGSAVGRRQIGAENRSYSRREPSPSYNHLFEGNNGALLSLSKYMTELQFKVASLIPTLLLRFKCALVPEGEGFCLPLPPGYPGAAGSTRLEGTRVREECVMNYEKITKPD